MDCIDRIDELIDYCAGDLNAARSGEIARHVAECDECRGIVEAQRAVWFALDKYAAPEVSMDFDAKLYRRIAQEEAAPLWRRWALRIFEPALPVAFWKPAVSVLAACGVLAIGLMVRTPQAAEPKQIHAEHAVDIETVATALDDLEMLTPTSAM
jgi:anti-sigma factor RsiW